MAIAGFGCALFNSSHGLSFAQKTTLALVMLLAPWLPLMVHAVAHSFHPVAAVTRAHDVATLMATVFSWSFAAGHVCAHVMGLLAARLYLTHERLQESYQRLHYDVQNPARPPDDRCRVARGLLATRRPGARDAPSASSSSGPASTSDASLLHEAAPAAAVPSDTDPNEAEGPARSDSLPSLPPGPPSSASSASMARSGVGLNREWQAETQRHAEAVGEPAAAKTYPTWAELDAQFYAEQRAAESAAMQPAANSAEPTEKTYPTWAELDAQFYAEQRAAESAAMLPAATSSAAGAASSSVGQSTVPPPSWVELVYRRFYAERAARSPAEPGGAPPMGQPPTWAELYALRAAGLAANEQGAVQGGSAAEQEPDVLADVAAARALTDLGQRPGGR